MQLRSPKLARLAVLPGRLIFAWTLVALMTAFFLETAPARAQFQQYTPPGQDRGSSESLKEDLEKDVADARWRLGGLRLQPQLKLQNLTFVNDVFVGTGEETSDLTAGLGLGLTAYLPMGPKSTVVAFALPEYVWWQEQSDRRRLNESYGAGVFSYFNRLTVELSGSRQETQGFASSELEQLVTTSSDSLGGLFSVRISRSLWLELEGRLKELQYLSAEERDDPRVARFNRLDREEDVIRAGLRIELRGDWTLGAGIEQSDVVFLDPSNDLSNSGTSPYVTMNRGGGRADLGFDIAFRSLDPEGTSTFEPFDEVTGSAELVYHLAPTLDLAVTGSRHLVYSVSEDFEYSVSQRTGLQLRKNFRRTQVDLFYEVGELEYATGDSSTQQRIDDYFGWGGNLEVSLWKRTVLLLGATVTDFQSNFPGFDRSVTRWTSTFSFGDTAWP